jgi:hypothetical protein
MMMREQTERKKRDEDDACQEDGKRGRTGESRGERETNTVCEPNQERRMRSKKRFQGQIEVGREKQWGTRRGIRERRREGE